MRPEKIKQEINKLNLAEKLLLVEDIWDSIAQGNSELPLPEWQKRELDKRYKEYHLSTYQYNEVSFIFIP